MSFNSRSRIVLSFTRCSEDFNGSSVDQLQEVFHTRISRCRRGETETEMKTGEKEKAAATMLIVNCKHAIGPILFIYRLIVSMDLV